MKGTRRYTISFSCVQASFWMSLCVFMGFAAVYLQHLGYTNAELGLVMAAGTLLGSILGPELSSVIDRSTGDRITAVSLTPPVLAAEALALIVLIAFPVKGPVTSIAFALFTALSTSVNSLDLKLYTDAVYGGLDIDFGITRSMGSLGYVACSFIVGNLCEMISPRIVPAAGLFLCAMQYLSFRYFAKYIKADASGSGAESRGGMRISSFLIRHRHFCLVLIGSMLIFYAHNTLCNFFINVVRNAGGDTGDMGMLNGLMALFETPVIFFYSRITSRWKTSSVLRAAFIIFTFKAAAVALAGSVTHLAAALLLQPPSFGLYTGAIVIYTNLVIPHEDSAKAQSLAFSVTILGSVLASTISGHMFDIFPVSTVMWTACAVSAAGSLLTLIGVRSTADGRQAA